MHSNSRSESYAAAGVDITAGYKAVELMKKHVARTKNEGCLDDVGGFGGCFGLPMAGMEEPVLVSGTKRSERRVFFLSRDSAVVAYEVHVLEVAGSNPAPATS